MTFPAKPKIAVVGTGAIGGYYGCMLARNGEDVRFFIRSDWETVQQRGLEVRRHKPRETFRISPSRTFNDVRRMGTADLVIVAAKATANSQLADTIRPLLHPDSYVLTLQNGLGNVEALAELLPVEQILGGLCFVCINRVEPGVFENFMPGRVVIGEGVKGAATKVAEAVVTRFSDAGIPTTFTDNLKEALWKKLCWNIPFNGLAIAGGGITTDKILGDPGLHRLARLLMEEVQEAAGRLGVTISHRFLEQQFEVTHPMGAYKPSSMIDFVEGRPVEVEAIWGEPLRTAAASGISMPHLETLYHLLKYQTQTQLLASNSAAN